MTSREHCLTKNEIVILFIIVSRIHHNKVIDWFSRAILTWNYLDLLSPDLVSSLISTSFPLHQCQ